MPAVFALFRAALPWMATIFGTYFLTDVFNEREATKQAQAKANYPAIVTGVFKRNPGKWTFLAIGGLIVGVIVAWMTKRFK